MSKNKHIRRGYQFEAQFKKSFLKMYPHGFIYKMVDMHSIEGALKIIKKTNPRYTHMELPKVPSDFICVFSGETVFVECKSTSNQHGFPLRNIRDSQITFANKIVANGGAYLFILRKTKRKANEYYLLTTADIKRLSRRKGNETEINWSDIRSDKRTKNCKRLKGSLIDLSELFK